MNPNVPLQIVPAPPPAGPADDVTALAALYQGEKTGASYVFNTAMVMMGAAVAYLVGAIPFVGTLNRGPIAWLFLLLLPLPLWLIAAFHSLIALNAMSHGISVRIIEDALFNKSGLKGDRELVGSAAGDKIMDITRAKPTHVITTLIVYGGIAFLIAGFTVYTLHSSNELVRNNAGLIHARVVEIATVIYLLLAVIVACSWIEGLRIINKGHSEISTGALKERRPVPANWGFLGSHYVLSLLPIWATAILLYSVTTGVVYVLRDNFEGLPYQVAYSAQFGDAALLGAILIAATILHRGKPLPWRYSRGYFHVLSALVSLTIGITWWSLDRPSHCGDLYHHFFVAPLILYLAITLFPVILINGTRLEKAIVLCFVLSWATLVAFDLTQHRMNQRAWLQAHGVTLRP
jgi:hypothetical protein